MVFRKQHVQKNFKIKFADFSLCPFPFIWNIYCVFQFCFCGSNKADGRLSSSLSPKLPNQNIVQFAKWDCQFVVIITTLQCNLSVRGESDVKRQLFHANRQPRVRQVQMHKNVAPVFLNFEIRRLFEGGAYLTYHQLKRISRSQP